LTPEADGLMMISAGFNMRSVAVPTALILLMLLAPTGCSTLFGPSSGQTASEIEQEILLLVNEHRAGLNLAALVWNDDIAEVARSHSQDMADGKVAFGHDGFYDRVALLGSILGCSVVGEVIAYSDSAANAVNALIASNDHRYILEGDYTLSGVGVVKEASGQAFYATQMFTR
jgi:uncharacterized protein YkwD